MMCANKKSLRHTQSEQGVEKMFGLRVVNREQKVKIRNKRRIWNLKPVWMFGYELSKVTPEL
jgi:hypothetical protein